MVLTEIFFQATYRSSDFPKFATRYFSCFLHENLVKLDSQWQFRIKFIKRIPKHPQNYHWESNLIKFIVYILFQISGNCRTGRTICYQSTGIRSWGLGSFKYSSIYFGQFLDPHPHQLCGSSSLSVKYHLDIEELKTDGTITSWI